ncbi:class I SAM-dependent methyltransferase [Marinomonas primoryensis]|uniref:Methyltransferase n=1 Tax=Marinomonas primoryensis TaxID=178399 RepID=A0A859CZD1_9GAMM|nr:class I SAM-dependent methyltransferase [Marinomonas primoryensis]QKK81958.1 uncharacterized protein MP3633_3231 [Marinomonas primoryensis]
MNSRFTNCPCCESLNLTEKKNENFKVPQKSYDFFYGGWQYIENIVRCRNCGFQFVGKLIQSYSSFYQDFGRDNPSYTEANVKRKRYFKELRSIIEKSCNISLNDLNNVLDVGSGDGVFLSSLSDLVTKTAVEPSPDLRHQLQKQGVNVYEDLSDIPSSMFFQLITLNDVLEHIENPASFLSCLARHLTPDGIIVISVPDYSRLIARVLKEKYYLTTPMHLSYFTWSSLKYLADNQKELEFVKSFNAPVVYAQISDAFKWLKINDTSKFINVLNKVPISYRSNFVSIMRRADG